MLRPLLVCLALAGLGACETTPSWLHRPDATATTATPTAASSTGPTSIAATYNPTPEQQLLDLERQLAAAAQDKGLGGALGPALDATDGFVLRPGEVVQGAEAVQRALNTGSGPIMWQPDRVFVSQSGDMGMTSGRYVQVVPGAEAAQGRYIAVWRKDSSGQWRLLSQTRVPDPPRAAPARPARRR